jgi:hypothetical protein
MFPFGDTGNVWMLMTCDAKAINDYADGNNMD